MRLLTASPLLAFAGAPFTNDSADLAQVEDLITAPEQALDVMEFEAGARKNLPRQTPA